jgi:prevent-host-death family protein
MTCLVISRYPDRMPQRIAVAEAKAQFSNLLRLVESGEDVIVTRNGTPVARIAPIRPREGGFMRGEVVVHDPDWWLADDDLAEQFEA